MKLKFSTCSSLLLAQSAQAFTSFTPGMATRAQLRQKTGAALSMKSDKPAFEKMAKDFAKNLATIAAGLAVMTGGGHDADAAQSGGRMGGRSFSAPPRMQSAPSRSYSAPSRSYSAPSQSYQPAYGGTYRSSTTIVPIPMPMPMMSPFGYGGGYYGGGGGVSVVSSGPSIIDIVIVGGVIFTASQLLRSQTGSRGGWSSVDDDSASSLGKGVGILKLQLALSCSDRSSRGILGQLKSLAERAETGSRGGLSDAVSEACLALVRQQPNWIAANSQFEYFQPSKAERAEAVFNSYAIAERSKVERETVARFGGEDFADDRKAALSTRAEDIGRPTQAVVTLVLALRGESLKKFSLERSLNSASAVRNVLTALAGDVATDDGENVLGAELLWTPEEPWESLDRQDVIADFPELIDL